MLCRSLFLLGRIVACLLLVGLGARHAAAAGGSGAGNEAVRVEAANPEQLEATPGEVFTVIFRVTNTLAEVRHFTAHLDLPPAWQPVLPQRPFTLAPYAEDLRLISFQVPLDAPPGLYEVRYAARDQQNPASAGEGTVLVAVPPTWGLRLELDEAPRFAPADAPYHVRLFLFNEGNDAATAVLHATSNADLRVRLDPARLVLPPRSLRRVTVTVSPGEGRASAHRRHVLRVEARLKEAPEVRAHLGVVTDLVPPGGPGDGREALPAEVTLRGVGGSEGVTGQVGAVAAGPLLGGTVDAVVMVPDQRRTSFYRDRSRYGLRYASRALDLYLGDQVYALSPLTEERQYGFGGGAEVRAGRLAVGGFYHKQRHAFLQEAYGGASVGYQVSRLARLSAHYLRRRGFRDGDAVTLRTVLREGRTATADAECGFGVQTAPGSPVSRACSARLAVDWRWLSYSARLLQASEAYPGRYYGLSGLSGSTVVRPWRWMRLEASAQDQRRRYAPGDERRTRLYRVGGGLTARPGTHAAHLLAYYRDHRFDLVPDDVDVDRREASVQLKLGYDTRRLGLSGSAELGHVWNELLGYEGDFRRYRVLTRLHLGRQSASLSVEHLRGLTVYRRDEQAQWRASLGSRFRLGARTLVALTLSGFVDRSAGGAEQIAGTAQARVEHTFRAGPRLELSGRHFAVGDGLGGGVRRGTGEVSLALVVPLGLPVGTRRGGRRLVGRVYDAETGAGLEGVALTLGGETALTDATGAFHLARPEDGIAYLRLDRISAGLGRVPMLDMPLEVQPGTEADLEIPMLRSARLAGRIEVVRTDGASDLAGPGAAPEPAAVRDAVLELSGDGRRLRAVADRTGRFLFPEVPPGPWTLRVLHAKLPDYHAVEHETYAVPLAPGQHDHLAIRVLPRQRRIQMIESGTVVTRPVPDPDP